MSPLQTSKPTTNGVRFKNNVRIRNISSHRDLSVDEKTKCWYTPQDFSFMKQEIMILIKSEITEWEELRAFGLEAPHYCKLRRANIMRAKLIVLTEQEKLLRDGVTSSHVDIISTRLKSATRTSREEAQRRAAIAAAMVRAFEPPPSENPRLNKQDSLPPRPRSAISVPISRNRPMGWQRI